MVREFGTFFDTQDSADPTLQPGTFFGPRAIAIAGDELYVVDTGNERVQVFALDGTFRRAFGGHGSEAHQLIEPVGIAIGPDGAVYVADSSNGRISVFTAQGLPVRQILVDAWQGRLYFEPYLTFDFFGNLYASSSATASVEVYDPDGALLASLTSIGADLLQQPVGLATDADGSVLITDKGSNAVYRFDPLELPAPLIPDVSEGAGSPEASPAEPTVEARG
jgi:DNA-binding beta-propeller fold protein YncE